MPQQFSRTENPWSQISPFEYEGVLVSVMTYAGDDHSAATTVFTANGSDEIFHADKRCYRLHQKDSFFGAGGDQRRYIYAHPLEKVMTTWLDPIRPCSHCTQDIETTAEVVQEHDGVPESVLTYYEPGDHVVTTQISRDPTTGETTVRESTRPAYPNGGGD